MKKLLIIFLFIFSNSLPSSADDALTKAMNDYLNNYTFTQEDKKEMLLNCQNFLGQGYDFNKFINCFKDTGDKIATRKNYQNKNVVKNVETKSDNIVSNESSSAADWIQRNSNSNSNSNSSPILCDTICKKILNIKLFGLNLGETINNLSLNKEDLSKNKDLNKSTGLISKYIYGYPHFIKSFNPSEENPLFDKYVVAFTPITEKVVMIAARTKKIYNNNNYSDSVIEMNTIIDFLNKKYSKNYVTAIEKSKYTDRKNLLLDYRAQFEHEFIFETGRTWFIYRYIDSDQKIKIEEVEFVKRQRKGKENSIKNSILNKKNMKGF